MTYDERVQAYEAEGLTRSDAQGIVDLEDMRAAKKGDTMAHTPGPWEVIDDLSTMDAIGIYADKGGTLVAELRDPEDAEDAKQMQANAAFIVRACNSHEAILEALKLCVEALEFIPCRARNKAEEALRLAEGRG